VGAAVADDGALEATGVLPPALHRWVCASVWLLPARAVMLAASTVTHQPDFETEFGDDVRFVVPAAAHP
jgi:hypothetical protein